MSLGHMYVYIDHSLNWVNVSNPLFYDFGIKTVSLNDLHEELMNEHVNQKTYISK